MPDITLTTDWTDKGYSVGMLKGSLLKRFPHMRIYDISHSVEPFSIKQAAYILESCYRSFPSGTVHLVCVMPHYSHENEIVFFEKNGHSFVGPNNGLFSLIFNSPQRAGIIPLDYAKKNALNRTLCNAVTRLLRPDPNELEVEMEINQKLLIQPVVNNQNIKAIITFVDNFGNLVLNVDRKLFEKEIGKKRFSIYFKNHEAIRRLYRHYMEVAVGELLCRFNSAGFLEIACNNQSASQLLELKSGDAVQIEWKE